MATKVVRTENDLLNEIDYLKKELSRLEKYKKYEESAQEIKAIFDCFVNAGFTEDQAFTLINNAMLAGVRK